MDGAFIDPRVAILANHVRSHFTVGSDRQPPLEGIAEDSSVQSFLDDPSTPLLIVTYDAKLAENGVLFSQTLPDGLHHLIFVKIQQDSITVDNFLENICITSLSASPVASLFNTVRKVYEPLLLKDSRWSQVFDSKLQNLLSELSAGLGQALRLDTAAGKPGESILSPVDEFQYWAEVCPA